MAVDSEALVTNFLRGQSEITDVVGDRVYTDMPHDRQYPLILVTRVGGSFLINRPLWLDEALIQLDVFGGTHKQAQRLMGSCLDLLVERAITRHPEGSVTGVITDSIAYNPEDDFSDERGHARPRFTVTVNVLTHP